MKKTVFWSWQSDLPTEVTRDFIKKALNQALKKVNSELELEQAERIELDHDTKGEAGLVEIVKTIFDKIEDCEVFVADITPVAEVPASDTGKKVPNPNVMIELGYALHELGHKRIITVANLAFGGKPEDLPFDLRHRRGAITYSLKSATDPHFEKQLKSLVNELTDALRINLEAPREDRLVRNPRPALSLRFSGDMPAVSLIEQNVEISDLPSIEDIKTKTPIRKKNERIEPRSSLIDIYIPSPFEIGHHQRSKPFSQWTQDELDGYNRRVQKYHQDYEAYLEAVKEHRLLLQRKILVKLQVVNIGTTPATDLASGIRFPENVHLYEDNELPKCPQMPNAPPFEPNGFSSRTTLIQNRDKSYDQFLESQRRINKERSVIVFQYDKLQHGYSKEPKSFAIFLQSDFDIKSFSVNYYITADELPLASTGMLDFNIKRTEN